MYKKDSMRVFFCIIIAFIISLGIFFLAIFTYLYTIQDGELIQIDKTAVLEDEFYSQNFTKKKIFILGSSMVSALNATYIEEQISQNNHDYEVFNLAIPSDKPIKRFKTIDKIIQAEPDIIIYGIGFRDIQDKISVGQIRSEILLPDPRQFFEEFLWNVDMNSKFNFDVLSSTRTASLAVIDNILQKGIINPRQDKGLDEQIIFENTPFYKFYEIDKFPVEENEIRMQIRDEPLQIIHQPEKNKNIVVLKKMINIFQENNIDVIIFTSPYSKSYFEISQNFDNNVLNLIIKDIEYSTNVKVNLLHNKYNDTNIWKNFNHIMVNKNSTFYSEDIVKIIQNKMR